MKKIIIISFMFMSLAFNSFANDMEITKKSETKRPKASYRVEIEHKRWSKFDVKEYLIIKDEKDVSDYKFTKVFYTEISKSGIGETPNYATYDFYKLSNKIAVPNKESKKDDFKVSYLKTGENTYTIQYYVKSDYFLSKGIKIFYGIGLKGIDADIDDVEIVLKNKKGKKFVNYSFFPSGIDNKRLKVSLNEDKEEIVARIKDQGLVKSCLVFSQIKNDRSQRKNELENSPFIKMLTYLISSMLSFLKFF